jgi:hypothetical protein
MRCRWITHCMYVCQKTGMNSVATCIADVNNDFSVLALSLSPAPSSFGHGHLCGAIINNFGHLLIIVDSAWSWQYLIMDRWCWQYLSTAKWMVFWLVDLAHSEKFPLHQRHLKKANCWHVTCGCWSFQLQMWHPWLIFKTSIFLRAVVARGPCFVTLAVPNQFRYPVYGQEPGFLTHTHFRLFTEELIFSPTYYYELETGGHIVKHHIFQPYKAQHFTNQSLYFYKSDFSWNYNPIWSSPMRHLNFGICVGKSMTSQCGQ